MSFFAPWMLLGLLAAAVPIVLHMIRRRNSSRIVWGAWQFLNESLRLQRRKMRFEEILLLILRTLILAAAAFAFARPFLPELAFFGSGGGAKDVVIAIDASGSMGLRDKDGADTFSRAIEEARDLVDRAPSGTAFGIVVGDREPKILTPTPFTSRREILDILDGLERGDSTMDVPRTLEAAGAVLAAGNLPAKEIVVFGDGQGYGWKASDANAWRRVEKVLTQSGRRTPVVWRTITRTGKVRNAAVVSIVPSRRIFGTDGPVSFSVDVLNSGSEPFSPGELSFEVDGRRVASQSVGQILPGLFRTVTFSHTFEKSGHHEIATSLSAPDDIASDNAVTNSVQVTDELKVLLVDGRTGKKTFDRPSAYLEAALRPQLKDDKSAYLVSPVAARPSELYSTNVFRDVAVTVLAGVPFLSPRAAENLAKWTHSGGGLLVIPDPACDVGFYSNWMWRTERVMPATWTGFERFRGNEKPPTVRGAPVGGRMVFDGAGVAGTGSADVELMSDGAVASVCGRFGAGRVGMLAMPLDLEWTAFPARPAFPSYVHELVYSLVSMKSVGELRDTRWSAREGDVAPLTQDEADSIAPFADLSYAREKDDALAAIAGKGFGVEIWRPLAITVLVLLVLELLVSFRSDRSRLDGVPVRRPVLFTILRVVSFLSILWMLLHVVIVHERTRRISRKVAVLVDMSESMTYRNIPDGTNRVSRFDTATNVSERLESALHRKYDVESFTFGGETTDFAVALEDVRARIPPEELAGAVVVSDGRATAGENVDAISRQFGRQAAKIAGVLVAGATNRCDVAIAFVSSAENVFLGDDVRTFVDLRGEGLKGSKVVAKFMLGDREIGREERTIDADAWTGSLRFTDRPESTGVRRYRIVLEVPEGDAETANDEWPFDVAVSDDRVNVLLADRRPRWEFRYLRNLFYGRDKSVNLQYFLSRPDVFGSAAAAKKHPAADARRRFGDSEAGALPQDREAWRRFAVMIFGDLSREDLTDEAIEEIRSSVEKRGATAVFIAGPDSMPGSYAGTGLAELLPVSFTNAQGGVSAKWSAEPYRPVITGAGLSHPIMELAAGPVANRQAWDEGEDWYGRLSGISARTGAEVLAFASDSTATEGPLVVVRHVGRGKVVFIACDETWRLRYRVGDTYHHRFWGNILKWAAGARLRGGNAFVRLGTDGMHYAPGSEVKVMARLADEESLPVSGAEVFAVVADPAGHATRIRLRDSENANGGYEATFAATETLGQYRIELDAPAVKARIGDSWPEKAEVGFSVGNSFAPLEYADLSSTPEVLERMAKLSGGTVVVPEDAEKELAEYFGAGRSEVTEQVESDIWDNPIAFIVLALAMAAVWIWRRRKGLA